MKESNLITFERHYSTGDTARLRLYMVAHNVYNVELIVTEAHEDGTEVEWPTHIMDSSVYSASRAAFMDLLQECSEATCLTEVYAYLDKV